MTQFTIPPITPVSFNGLAVFAWMAIFLLIGMFIRAKVPFFRRFLIPSCIIGGTVGLIFQATGLINLTGFPLDNSIMQNAIYHLFNLTWIFVGLKVPVQTSTTNSKEYSKRVLWAVGIQQGTAKTVLTFAMLGTTLLTYLGLNSGPYTIGTLTANGFLMGPGPALGNAKVWQQANDSFIGLSDYALASGAMGFLISIVVGIFFMNIIARKKKLELLTSPSPEEECGFYDDCTETALAGRQTTSSNSIDVLAWHLALALGTYLLSLMIAVFASIILPPAAKPIIWSLFFTICMLVAVGVRRGLAKFDKVHLLDREINNRVSNTLIDFMVCGTFMSIVVGNVYLYIVPFIVSCFMCTISVAIPLWLATRKLKEEGPELFAYIFGSLTGTVSTAFVLLRLVDPGGRTNVIPLMAMAAITATPIAITTQIFFHTDPVYGWSPWIGIGACAAIALGSFLLSYFCRQPSTKTAWEPDAGKQIDG